MAEEWVRYLTPGPVHRRLGLVCLGVGTNSGRVPACHDRALGCHALVVILDGDGSVSIGGRRHPVSGPAMFWLPPGLVHGYGPAEAGWTHWWVLFDGPAAAAYRELGYLSGRPPVADLAQPDPITRAFARLAVAADSVPDPETVAAACLHDLLVTIRRHGCQQAEHPALATLRRLAPGRHPVADLARRCGCSERKLRQIVRRATGQGPAGYLVTIRLNLAKELLATTGLPVAAVARRVGYDDPGYFTRLFRHRVGSTPVAFRDQQRHEHLSNR